MTELLHYPDVVASVWPAFSELRRAAHATKRSQLQLMVSTLVADARVVFGACLIAVRGSPSPSDEAPARPGGLLHLWIQTLLAHGHDALSELWHWPSHQTQFLYSQLSGVVTQWSGHPCGQCTR